MCYWREEYLAQREEKKLKTVLLVVLKERVNQLKDERNLITKILSALKQKYYCQKYLEDTNSVIPQSMFNMDGRFVLTKLILSII